MSRNFIKQEMNHFTGMCKKSHIFIYFFLFDV